ncbi:MAG: MotA/TolQ/ExbB proton channel family protein [Clostridia bacterium]|nr:MotA/TolQ/ExbB proton channel family protein [Clostridia bacterium]
MSFFEKMFNSISEDWYIFAAAAISVICLLCIWWSVKEIDKSFDRWKNENHYSKLIYNVLTISYNLFLTLITIFPLLGMFGTVKSLLSLNFMDEAAMLIARNSFFDALTSTAWGIIFALLFKTLNAFISTYVDDSVNKVSSLIDNKATNIGVRSGLGKAVRK